MTYTTMCPLYRRFFWSYVLLLDLTAKWTPGSWAHSNVTIVFAVQIRLSIYLGGYNFEIRMAMGKV